MSTYLEKQRLLNNVSWVEKCLYAIDNLRSVEQSLFRETTTYAQVMYFIELRDSAYKKLAYAFNELTENTYDFADYTPDEFLQLGENLYKFLRGIK